MASQIHPDISAVVPVHNKATFLEACVSTVVRAAAHAEGVELIFVENRSTDGSEVVLSRAFGGVGLQIRSLAPNAGAARNEGAAKAKGEILCFLDADCELPLDYFQSVRRAFAHDWIHAAGCSVDLPTDRTWIERAWYRLHRKGDGFRSYINSGNLAVRRAAFVAVGGFDERLETGEDANLGERLNQKGFSVVELRSLRVLHVDNPRTLREFYRKEVWHAKGMLGTTGFGHLDRPLVMTVLHLFLVLAALGLAALAVTSRPAIAAPALVLPLLVPLSTVAFRHAMTQEPINFPEGIVLYLVYFLARARALLGLVASWTRHAFLSLVRPPRSAH